MLVLCKASAKKLRVRAGKIGGPERREGHSNFLLKRRIRAGEAAQKFCSPRFYLNCRAKAYAQRSLFADLIFWLLFHQGKSNLALAAKSVTKR
jgi:hypothetical protein